MKVKTSITITEELIRDIDAFSGGRKNRSEVIEEAVRDYLLRQANIKRDMDDLSILNKQAATLNKEAEDVLSYQAEL